MILLLVAIVKILILLVVILIVISSNIILIGSRERLSFDLASPGGVNQFGKRLSSP